MEQVQISAKWQAIHQTKVVDVRAIYKARGEARYLVKYLMRESFNRYWAHNWVFSGWMGWPKRVNCWIGHYPSKRLLQGLARFKVSERIGAM